MQALLLLAASKGALAVVALSSDPALSAKEWMVDAIAPAGGKGGGNVQRAQGASRDATEMAKCVEAATAFATAKLS
ncbi:hypothetical protein T492DRAFT_908163 [Pavlovales sp. CCMP2436]|nr:hypothetical protein T492DRAFT_908163 [Pavlovales sp. CCMP2436]